jgi:7,8-dihydropterin-6-yl-methyl-4-(beta-D-ribofuranosyl)aminobenzene 5'-phosphate synthase
VSAFRDRSVPPAAGFFTGGSDNNVPDRFDDEQALVVEEEGSLVVVLGCGHPGVERCLRRILAEFPGRTIGALVAGMHLIHAGKERIEQTLDALWEIDIGRLVPLHCTGLAAIARMADRWGGRCEPACAGETVEL